MLLTTWNCLKNVKPANGQMCFIADAQPGEEVVGSIGTWFRKGTVVPLGKTDEDLDLWSLSDIERLRIAVFGDHEEDYEVTQDGFYSLVNDEFDKETRKCNEEIHRIYLGDEENVFWTVFPE